MKGLKKYLVAVCVLALFGALLAGCSGQSSSSAASSSASASASASSSAAQASTEEIIKEIEAIPGLEDAKSITIEVKGVTTIDMDAMLAGLTESSSASASSASAESASSESASAESAASSESSVLEIPTEMVIKADSSQSPEKLFLSMSLMGIPFDMYVTGENVVVVLNDQAYSGTLQDLEALGMSGYNSVESIMASNGSGDFSAYKDAVESATKEEVNGETLYTIVVDASKINDKDLTDAFAQMGMTDDAAKITLTYTVGADGKLSACTMDLAGTGFSMTQDLTISDYDKTVVPDAPEATMSISDFVALMGSGQAETANAA